MKITDLNEWEEAKPWTPKAEEMPSAQNATSIGNYPTEHVNIDVKKEEKMGEITYYACDHTGNTIGYMIVKLLRKPYGQVKRVETIKPQQGIAKGLYLFVVRIDGIKLISDNRMTTLGAKVWDSLINNSAYNNGVKVCVVDMATQSRYSIEQAKSQKVHTHDHDIVTLPELDKRPPTNDPRDFRQSGSPQHQRFYYLAEAWWHQDCHMILEEIKRPPIELNPFPIFEGYDDNFWKEPAPGNASYRWFTGSGDP